MTTALEFISIMQEKGLWGLPRYRGATTAGKEGRRKLENQPGHFHRCKLRPAARGGQGCSLQQLHAQRGGFWSKLISIPPPYPPCLLGSAVLFGLLPGEFRRDPPSPRERQLFPVIDSVRPFSITSIR